MKADAGGKSYVCEIMYVLYLLLRARACVRACVCACVLACVCVSARVLQRERERERERELGPFQLVTQLDIL